MKMYAWPDLEIDYIYNPAIAIASSEEEAKKLIEGETRLGSKITGWGEASTGNLKKKQAFFVMEIGEI